MEVRLAGDKLARRLGHWQGVVVAACEQCGRATVPEVRAPLPLAEWLALDEPAPRVVLAPSTGQPLTGREPGSRIALVIGPEGGFSEQEMSLMERRGVESVSLGPRILRTETAAPAAVAVLQALAGDFR